MILERVFDDHQWSAALLDVELHVADNHLLEVARTFDLQPAPAWWIDGTHTPFCVWLRPVRNANPSLAATALRDVYRARHGDAAYLVPTTLRTRELAHGGTAIVTGA